MALNDAQYERIARRLDGQDVELSEQERMAADEIRRRQVDLAAMLDVNAPPEVLAGARRRMRAMLIGAARPRRRSFYLAVATAAAAVLVAILYLKPFVGSKDVEIPAEVLFSEPVSPEMDQLAQDVEKLGAYIGAYASAGALETTPEPAGALETTPEPDEFYFEIEALWLADSTESGPW